MGGSEEGGISSAVARLGESGEDEAVSAGLRTGQDVCCSRSTSLEATSRSRPRLPGVLAGSRLDAEGRTLPLFVRYLLSLGYLESLISFKGQASEEL